MEKLKRKKLWLHAGCASYNKPTPHAECKHAKAEGIAQQTLYNFFSHTCMQL